MEKISLINFESHKKTTIDIAPPGQLTVITGPTDSGKTSILRAIQWVMENEPAGNDFIRSGASKVEVSINFGEHKITREKSAGGINRYMVDNEKFEGFGNSVPVEVRSITGVRPAVVGDMEFNLNIAEQLDAPFLGSKTLSAPGRAKILGKLAGTEEVDLAAQEAAKDLRNAGQEDKRLREQRRELQEELDTFGYLPILGWEIEQLNEIVDKVEKARQVSEQLKALQKKYDALNADIKATEHNLETYQFAGKAADYVLGAREAIKRLSKLVETQDNYNKVSSAIEDCNAALLRYKDTGKAIFHLNKANSDLGVLNLLRQLFTEYREFEERVSTASHEAVESENRVAELEAAFKDELASLGMCPLCGNKIDSKNIKEVV